MRHTECAPHLPLVQRRRDAVGGGGVRAVVGGGGAVAPEDLPGHPERGAGGVGSAREGEEWGEWGSQDREPAGEVGGGEEDGRGWEDDPACVHQLQEFGMNDLYLVSLYLGIVWGAVELAAGLLGWK